MSLYVRVFTNFYTHRKTARLRAALGNDAFWIPPRVWAYAAENQSDGDFSDYSEDELAILIGYQGIASSMLQALRDAGFLDGMKIHNWETHNLYHSVYAERAKKAAAKRWKNKGKEKDNDTKGKEKSKHDSSMLQACEQIYAEYPKKVARKPALESIRKSLLTKDFDSLFLRTKQFCDAMKGSDPRFIPYPATWFNQERYNDDPSTWKNANYHSNPKPNPRNIGVAKCGIDYGEAARRLQAKQNLEREMAQAETQPPAASET